MKPTILIVDDEQEFCQTVEDILRHRGYNALSETNPVQALEIIEQQQVDVLLLDIQMPQMDGREVLSRVMKTHPEIPVIILTGQSYNVPVAVETSHLGAFNFIGKDNLDITALSELVRQALEAKSKMDIPANISEILQDIGMVAVSDVMLRVIGEVERVAKTNVSILITGESGVGKEVLANAIHKRSNRRDKRFVSIDCGSVTETLLESELFGHVKGAFTGATTDKVGLFEEADGGTIFLDEIGNTTPKFQQELLRVLNSGLVRRVGDTKEKKIDVRIISATNEDLWNGIRENRFREDLYYRLNRYSINVPPLRERPEDVVALARYLLRKTYIEQGIPERVFTKPALELLKKQEWRGNVRELESIVTKLALFAEQERIDHTTVAHALAAAKPDSGPFVKDHRPLRDQVEDFERKLIIEALKANEGNRTKAAEALGVERTNFVKKIRKHEIKEHEYL